VDLYTVDASLEIPYRSPYIKEFLFGKCSRAKAGSSGSLILFADSYNLLPMEMVSK
jgi:hypothetical protein